MNVKKSYLAALIIVSIVLGSVLTYVGVEVIGIGQTEQADGGSQQSNAGTDGEKQELIEEFSDMNAFSKVMRAYSVIENNYVEDVKQKTLVEGAVQGMLDSLGDPHSVYMDKETVEQFNHSIESSFEGIGAEVSMRDGHVTIVSPIKGSPAEDAGLQPKDQILEVDGESLDGFDLNEAVAKIRGEKGTEVELTIQRPGVSDAISVNVVRDDIPVETVYPEVKNQNGKKTGVIQITSFSQKTAEEFNQALSDLEDKGIEGLVIDVRGNPGGLFTSVETILENFIPEDQPYVIFEKKNGEKQRYYSGTKEKKNYPITVLTNKGSASASEILAAAMLEAGYPVVGEKSYGKGTVQKTLDMGDGSQIKITTYKWLTPDGTWINEKGIEPTVKVQQPEFFYTTPVEVENPLTLDMNNENVANIQTMLKGIGYDPGRTDGYFSEQTAQAVEAFQKDHDLEVTGKVNQETGEQIQAQVVEAVSAEENDRQLNKALEVLYEQ
ncbi:carboxyl-terminal processing protease [Salinibacillus kushneri]|uniref:C-terminal processing peptidase n=1 Tax=Salinibacillus kushneri TaxID=237682 RepID=A0A1H9YPH1_9BACI|nr:S41 family peptidase [Salinibacillus kushneri]SES70980.1 carboxyl-terminal processing protease [Salinibacillus kushneri]